MNRPAVALTALLAFGVVIVNFVLARNLITPLAQAEERGSGVAWYLVWGMVILTLLCGVALGLFLLASIRNPSRR
jgi:multisubunit Na+/H+ antiporter MnhB subunit